MKRVLCPKCENYLYFDETKYSEGQSLVFECEHCGKQFSIRLGKSKVKALRKEENLEEEAESHKEEFGYITVIENVFGFKQLLPLQEGDNVIGRRCVGTNINTPIESGDMSMDRRHCIINIKRNKQGKLVYTLRDAPSLTGTFLMNEILGDKDRVRIEDGAIVTQIKLQKTAIDFSTCFYCRTFNFIIKYLANRIQFSIFILAVQQ